jgi:hypothetical protein
MRNDVNGGRKLREQQPQIRLTPESQSSVSSSEYSAPPTPPELRQSMHFTMVAPKGYVAVLNKIQQSCSVAHRQCVRSRNVHHRVRCMACQTDEVGMRWVCSYCALRFCSACRGEFFRGKNIKEIQEACMKNEEGEDITIDATQTDCMS